MGSWWVYLSYVSLGELFRERDVSLILMWIWNTYNFGEESWSEGEILAAKVLKLMSNGIAYNRASSLGRCSW